VGERLTHRPQEPAAKAIIGSNPVSCTIFIFIFIGIFALVWPKEPPIVCVGRCKNHSHIFRGL
jgi:hypothetical protein